jgi:hypothetical protein
MKRSDLVELLNALPDVEVGTEIGQMVIGVETSYYEDDKGMHDYIALVLDEG